MPPKARRETASVPVGHAAPAVPADPRLAGAAQLLEEAGAEIARLHKLLALVVDPAAEDAAWQLKTLCLQIDLQPGEPPHKASERMRELYKEAAGRADNYGKRLDDAREQLGASAGETFEKALERVTMGDAIMTPDQWLKIRRACGRTVDDAEGVLDILGEVRKELSIADEDEAEDLDKLAEHVVSERNEARDKVEALEAAQGDALERTAELLREHQVLGPALSGLEVFDRRKFLSALDDAVSGE